LPPGGWERRRPRSSRRPPAPLGPELFVVAERNMPDGQAPLPHPDKLPPLRGRDRTALDPGVNLIAIPPGMGKTTIPRRSRGASWGTSWWPIPSRSPTPMPWARAWPK
jgi:hypothetical protein